MPACTITAWQILTGWCCVDFDALAIAVSAAAEPAREAFVSHDVQYYAQHRLFIDSQADGHCHLFRNKERGEVSAETSGIHKRSGIQAKSKHLLTAGMRWTALVVPSTGSTIKVGLSVSW